MRATTILLTRESNLPDTMIIIRAKKIGNPELIRLEAYQIPHSPIIPDLDESIPVMRLKIPYSRIVASLEDFLSSEAPGINAPFSEGEINFLKPAAKHLCQLLTDDWGF